MSTAKRGSPAHHKKISDSLKRYHASKTRWISKAIKRPGALHKQLGIAADKKIPISTLHKVDKGNSKLAKRARLALELRSFKHKRK